MGISFRGSVAQNDLLVQLRPEPGSESVELAIPIRNKLQAATKWLVGILTGAGHAVDLPHQLRVTKDVFLFHMVGAAIQLAGRGLADCVEINAIRFAPPELNVLLYKTPYVALISGAVVGYLVLMLMYFLDASGSGAFGGVILNMAVFGAVIAYAMQMISYIVIKRKYPQLDRPFVSPLGTAGAVVALLISLVTLVLLFQNPDFRPGVMGVAIWFLLGLLYFGLHGRKTLVYSPEEEFAISLAEENGQ